MRIINGYIAFFIFILFMVVGVQFSSISVLKEHILLFYSAIGATIMFIVLHFSLMCKN